ncbi:MAG: FtsQ-type POTRA domain-containing protein [bacterium]
MKKSRRLMRKREPSARQMGLFEPLPFAQGPPAERVRADAGPRRLSASVRVSFWLLGLGACVLAVLVLLHVLRSSPLFALKRIEVMGGLRASLGDLRSWGGVELGGNLLTLDIQEVSRRLEAQPGIESASIAKRFPNELVVRIEQRRPALVAVVDRELYYMDAGGVVFRKVGPGDVLDLPVISGLRRSALACGARPEGRQVRKALELLRLLEQSSNELGAVSEIRVDPTQGLTFFLADLPAAIRVGWEDFGTKLDRLERIYPTLLEQRDTLRTVDLQFARQIVVRRTTGPALAARREGANAVTRVSAVFPDR